MQRAFKLSLMLLVLIGLILLSLAVATFQNHYSVLDVLSHHLHLQSAGADVSVSMSLPFIITSALWGIVYTMQLCCRRRITGAASSTKPELPEVQPAETQERAIAL